MTKHLDDDGFVSRLAAALKGWEEALLREKELERELKLCKLTYAEHCVTVFSRDALLATDAYQLERQDVSTPGERAVRLEVIRTERNSCKGHP